MEQQMKTWTIRTIHNGDAVRVEKGVSNEDAVVAIYRAMRGQDPIGAGLTSVRGERSPVADTADTAVAA
jgi:hypothetical protein